MVIRDRKIFFKTEEQQHGFNFPYQLGTGSQDSPTDAETYKIQLKEGDVVIMGTDGLYDNVFEDEILETVIEIGKAGPVDPKKVTDRLLERARETAENRRACSPFQQKARKEGYVFSGGKMDDITIAAGVVEYVHSLVI